MAKSINLALLAKAGFLSLDEFRKYEKMLSGRPFLNHLGERERDSICALVSHLDDLEIKAFDNFYYSYSIPKIGKEFDLLKFGEKKILSIELKSENVGFERIKIQLELNKRYLKYLGKPLKLYTFVMDEKAFYELTSDNKLVKVNKEKVINDIISLENEEEIDVDKLFHACEYLVSPINEVDKFLNNRYFLTTHQDFIKKTIFQNLNQKYFKISGEAGTGKTLLLYDLAKELSNKGKVRIISLDKLTTNIERIDLYFDNIIISNIHEINNVSEEYLLIDDCQRLKVDELKKLTSLNKKIIFFIDPKQIFTQTQVAEKIDLLINKLNPLTFKLTNSIRINNDLYYFTRSIFDLNYHLVNFNHEDIMVSYAANINDLNNLLIYYEALGYQLIAYPNSHQYPVKSYRTEEVVSNEFNQSVLIIDADFIYEEGKLKTKGKPFFLKENLLYQGLVRTKEKVIVICYRNKTVFKQIIKQIERVR